MHLTEREQERLQIFTAAQLARRRRDRGRKLNAPEAIAILLDELLELAWDGDLDLPGLTAAGAAMIDPADLMDGVAALVPEIQVEVMFPSGTALCAIPHPFGPAPADGPGSTRSAADDVLLNEHRLQRAIQITNDGDQPVFLSSHYPVAQANPRLRFDREAAADHRLDIPAGTAARFGPGETTTVTLVPYRRKTDHTESSR